MIQDVIVLSIFAAAVILLGRMLYRALVVEESCNSGCGKCGVDFDKIDKQLREKVR